MSRSSWGVVVTALFAIVAWVTPVPERWRNPLVFLAWVALVLSLLGWVLAHTHLGQRLRSKRKATHPVTLLIIFVIGGFLTVAAWKLVPTSANESALARTEFLLEATKPLKQVTLVIVLKKPATPEVLKHFRVMLSISDMDFDAQYANATNKDNPHPTLCIGGRDYYPVATFAEKNDQKWFGVHLLVWALNPDNTMQTTLFSMGQTETSQIMLGGNVNGKGPFKTLGDLDERWVDVYITEPLFQYIDAIHFVGNDYLLLSERADNLAREDGPPLALIKWREVLTLDEQNIKWISLMPKGSDYDRFQKEKQQLGHDSEWFPRNFYRSWNLRFTDYTPKKLTLEQRLALGLGS